MAAATAQNNKSRSEKKEYLGTSERTYSPQGESKPRTGEAGFVLICLAAAALLFWYAVASGPSRPPSAPQAVSQGTHAWPHGLRK